MNPIQTPPKSPDADEATGHDDPLDSLLTQIINGFSELMAQVFGDDAGVGARSAVGMGSLPGEIPVEIECIFEVS